MKILENEHQRIQDEKPMYLTNENSYISNASYLSSFRILSTISPNSISLQNITIKGQKLQRTTQSLFTIDEGKVVGFDVHPSGDYLLVTSNQGRIYLYRIDTGELRGTIKIPLHA